MSRFIKILLLFGVVSMLAACASDAPYEIVQSPIHYKSAPKPTVSELRAKYTGQLRADGVQIIRLGQTMRFVLLSDNVFNPNSANLLDNARPMLRTLARLMGTYETVNVKVAAYSDNSGSVKRQQAVTTRQAQVVAHYLWAHGIDARLEYAAGYNHQNSVDSNKNSVGRRNNRRIEVSFRFYQKQLGYV